MDEKILTPAKFDLTEPPQNARYSLVEEYGGLGEIDLS